MLGYIFLNDYKNHVKPHLGQFVLGFDPKFLQMQVRWFTSQNRVLGLKYRYFVI